MYGYVVLDFNETCDNVCMFLISWNVIVGYAYLISKYWHPNMANKSKQMPNQQEWGEVNKSSYMMWLS